MPRPNVPNQVPNDTNREMRWIEKTSSLLDNAIRVPGTNFRIGLDPIIGLIPVVGEVVTLGMSAVLVLTMVRHGASGKLILKLLANALVDASIGGIPVLGDLFDFGFKANQRNVRLLREYYHEGKHQGNAWGVWVLVVLLAVAWVGLVVWLAVWLFRWIAGAF